MGLQWCFLPISWHLYESWMKGQVRTTDFVCSLSIVVCSCPVWWLIQTWQWWMSREQTGCSVDLDQREVHPLLGLSVDEVAVGWPLQVLGQYESRKPECFHSRRSVVGMWWWGVFQGFPQNSTVTSTLLSELSSRTFWLRQRTLPGEADDGCIVYKRQEFSRWVSWGASVAVEGEKQRERVLGAAALNVWVLDGIFPILTCCLLSVRRFVARWQVGAATVSSVS